MMMEDATFFDMDDGLNTLPQQVQKIADTTSTPFTVSYSPPARHSSPPRAVPAPAPAPAPAAVAVAVAPQVEPMVASTSKTTSTQQTGIHRWLAAHRPYLPHDQPSSSSLAVPTTTTSSSSSKPTRSGRLLPVHNSTPTSAFSDSEDDEESSSDEFEEDEEDEEYEEQRQFFGQSSFLQSSSRRESGEESSSDSSEEEAEEEMIFLRPRRSHGSRPASAQRPTVSTTPSPIQQQQAPQHVRRRTPPMPLSLSAQRPALPIVDLAQASGTSSFDQPELAVIISTPSHSIPPPLQTAASSLPKSYWSDDEDEEEEEEEEEEVESIIDGEEALWLVVPPEDDLPALDADYEDATNDAPSTSTRSLPIPISLPLDHYQRTLTVDEQQLPLEVCVQKKPMTTTLAPAIVAQQLRREKEEEECGQSPPGHYRTSRLVFQRGQSFYKPWLEDYIHQPHHRHS